MPDMQEATRLRNAGIQALKTGKKEESRTLLMKSLEHDENNVHTWLWLSGAVDSNEDKRVCLENVLTIDPHNEMAKKGLAQLGVTYSSTPEEISMAEKEHEELVEDWSVMPAPVFEAPQVEYEHKVTFHDVWDSTVDICAYCAQEVKPDDKNCPKCKRKLETKVLVYEKPDKFYYFFLISLGFNVFNVLVATASLMAAANLMQSILMYVLAGVMGIIALGYIAVLIGAILRQYWAYWLVMALTFLQLLLQFAAVGMNPYSSIWAMVCQAGYILLIGYLIFAAGTSFQRETRRRVATISKGLVEADQFDSAGKRFAKQGMWASAVVHWRRAVGRDPSRTAYLRRLAQGYAQLGFLERSLDTLEHAYKMSSSPQVKETLGKQITRLKQQIETNGKK